MEISTFIKEEISSFSTFLPEEIKDDLNLAFDCSMDDFDLVDIIISIENKTGKTLPDYFETLDVNESTVGEFIKWVEDNLK